MKRVILPTNYSVPSPPQTASTYFYTVSPNGSSTLNSLGVGTMRVAPWLVQRPVSIARLGAEITSAGEAGSKLRIVLYADNGSGYPGALVVDAGQIAGDSATVQELTVSAAPTFGLYWVGGIVQSVTTTQPTVRICSSWTPAVAVGAGTTLGTITAGGAVICLSTTGITAAAPSTFPAGAAGSGNMPRIFARTA
jgi:hypothetical protein